MREIDIKNQQMNMTVKYKCNKGKELCSMREKKGITLFICECVKDGLSERCKVRLIKEEKRDQTK